MKKVYLPLLLSLVTFVSDAQIVNIPDANFKSALVTQVCIDTNSDNVPDIDADSNNDGQIQVSEALLVTQLYISDYFDGTNTFPVNNTAGLEAFSNLTTLSINSLSTPSVNLTSLLQLQTLSVIYTPGMSINITNLGSLTSIICQANFGPILMNLSSLPNLTSLKYRENFADNDFDGNLTGLTSLQYLDCDLLSSVSTLNLTQTPNLVRLNCPQNNLTALDLSGLAFLKEVDVSYNQITTMNTSGLTQIEKLICTDNVLTSLEVGGLTTLKELKCGRNQIATLNVSALTQLTILECFHNSLQVLQVSNLLQLKEIHCYSNQISVLDVANLTDLQTLYVSYNAISTLSLNALTQLIKLHCEFNPLNTIDVSTLINLENLNCSANGLTSLNVNQTNNPLIGQLNISENQFSTFDFSACPNLYKLDCAANLFTTIDLSGNTNLAFLNLNNSPNLVYINLKNGHNDDYLLQYSFCPNLIYICADETEIPSVLYFLEYDNITNVQVNSYCVFSPGGTYNTIAGTQTYDVDNNGCSVTDPNIPLVKVAIDDGTQSGATFTNSSGNYSFFTQAGSFVLTPVFENPYFTISPSTATITFGAVDSSTQTQNFCISPLGVHNDVEISLLPLSGFKPGFDCRSALVYKNKGNQIQSGAISLSLDDTILDVVNATPTIDSQSVNQISWNYTNLYPFETRYIYLTLNLNGPMETPAVNSGDILNFVASIDPIVGDETMADNTFPLVQTVVGSFDPNDKTCLEGNTITPEMVGNYLHYLIRFQNSGSAAAENVVIKDIIDTTKFDMASLQLTSSSHPQVTKIMGNKVEFQFENINLPAEIDDAPGSNGYVAFKIKTKSNLVIGDAVSNKADIFFDYNFPIETNTATTTVALLGVNQVENKSVSIAPNPTRNNIQITSKGNITSVLLFDVQGRILETMTTNDEKVDFDLSQKQSGVYFVKVYTIKGVKVEKIIKE